MTQPHSLSPASGDDTSTIFAELPRPVGENKIVLVNRKTPLRYFTTAGKDATQRVIEALCIEARQWSALYTRISEPNVPVDPWFNPETLSTHLNNVHKDARNKQQAITEVVDAFNDAVTTLIAKAPEAGKLREEIIEVSHDPQTKSRLEKLPKTVEALSKLLPETEANFKNTKPVVGNTAVQRTAMPTIRPATNSKPKPGPSWKVT